jgi:hypothetical protein
MQIPRPRALREWRNDSQQTGGRTTVANQTKQTRAGAGRTQVNLFKICEMLLPLTVILKPFNLPAQ